MYSTYKYCFQRIFAVKFYISLFFTKKWFVFRNFYIYKKFLTNAKIEPS